MQNLISKICKSVMAAAVLALVFSMAPKAEALAASAPSQVTGVYYNHDEGTICFSPITGTYKYEIMVTGDGRTFYKKDNASGKPAYYSLTSTNNSGELSVKVSTLSKLYAKDGSGNTIKVSGASVRANVPGKTYSVYVRAVNADANSSGTISGQVAGAWSTAVTYTVDKTDEVEKISNFAFNKYDMATDRYYFTIDAPVDATIVYRYSIYNNFSPALSDEFSYDYDMGMWYLSGYNLRMYEGSWIYMQCYMVDALGNYYTNGTDKNIVYSNSISFVAAARENKQASPVKNLKVVDNGTSFKFSADKSTSSTNKFILEYSTKSNFSDAKTVSKDKFEDLSVKKSDLSKDTTYYVRVKSYVTYTSYVWSTQGQTKAQFATKYGISQDKVFTDKILNLYFYEKSETNSVYSSGDKPTMRVVSAPTAIKSLKLKERTRNLLTFSYSGTLASDEKIQIQYCTNKNFTTGKGVVLNSQTITPSNPGLATLNAGDIKPGTYYFRARVIKTGYTEKKDSHMETYLYGSYTSAVKGEVNSGKATVSFRQSDKNSICVNLGTEENSGQYTGWELQRRKDGKYITIYKGTECIYNDTNVKPYTKYFYRARTYYYNVATKKYTYGSYVNGDAYTWGGALEVKATCSTKYNIKISWTTVEGAEGYEIYRGDFTADPSSTSVSKTNGFTCFSLVKTFSGSKTKSYTDKGRTQNKWYVYQVRAYKKINGVKCYITENSNSVYLGFSNVILTGYTTKTDGKVKVSWGKVPGASGYLIEKYSATSKKWSSVKKQKGTSYTFKKTTNINGTLYRIRAYKDKSYSGSLSVTIYPYVGVPSGVTASAQDDGSVKISWKKVSGASFYKVFRSTSNHYGKNADTKGYLYLNPEEVATYVDSDSSASGYKLAPAGTLTSTTAYDVRMTEKNQFGDEVVISDGPKPGTVYYYYVIAYKKVADASVYADGKDALASGASNCAKVTTANTSIKTPNIISAKASSSGYIQIKWKKTSDATGYEVLRSTSKKSGYSVIKTLDKNSDSFKDYNGKKGTKYYYRVRAKGVNNAGLAGTSPMSDYIAVTAK